MIEVGDGSWLHGRQESASAGGTWPVKHEAADLVRQILEELPRSGADEETLRRLLQPLRTVAETLTSAGPQQRAGDSPMAGMADFVYVSPIVGFANPLAPPFSFSIDAEAQVARGRGAFGRAHEGGPGIVHGGLLAAAIDELLQDAFVHISAVERAGLTNLAEGQAVEYELQDNNNGKTSAENLSIVG